MSALQFLNKKSWHVSTIKNNEKVWLKEQEAAKEAKRIEQLQKQLDEERKLEEIQRIEGAAGRLSEADALKARRLNWMYEMGPAKKGADKEKEDEQEKALLGKKEADLGNENWARKTALVDAENKLRQDPLFAMRMRKGATAVQTMRKRAGVVRYENRKSDDARRKREEKEAKKFRKEERERIREERRRRREERKYNGYKNGKYRSTDRSSDVHFCADRSGQRKHSYPSPDRHHERRKGHPKSICGDRDEFSRAKYRGSSTL